MSSTLLQQGALHLNVSDALRDMIVAGDLAPGSKVREPELCERFGISRTPLREALKVLASEGLIQLMPRRGAYVAQITQAEIDELFPIMAALEALAGELAVARLTDKDISKFRKLHDQLFACHVSGNEKDYLRLNREIHRELFTVAANSALQAMYEQLLVRTHAVRFVARKSSEQWGRAVEDHRAILAAIEERDGKRLAELLRDHLLGTASDVARQTLTKQ
ncbi:MAG: transcriptional regulator, GntR family [Devosia sp.]|nr:transcriptional regulator, GntR family [Devosia sp.]